MGVVVISDVFVTVTDALGCCENETLTSAVFFFPNIPASTVSAAVAVIVISLLF